MTSETMKNMVKLGLVDEMTGEEANGSRFINLTGHNITLILDGNRFVRLDAEGQPFRFRRLWSPPEQHDSGFEVVNGNVVLEGDLPSAKKGIILIVPEGVASVRRRRKDVFAPAYSGSIDERGCQIVTHLIQFK